MRTIGSGVGTCREVAPPDAFEPDVQWEWNGALLTQSVVTPLVVNLTDDDGNGTIDLCDIPDVVVTAFSAGFGPGRIVVLSGDTGTLHFEIPHDVEFTVTPALGDIDGDGLPEILSATLAGGTAFDFDGDGVAEAMYADETQLFVFDGMGNPLLTAPRQSGTGLEYPVVADIDNDGSAEIVVVSNFQVGMGSPAVQAIRDVQDRWIQARRIWNQHTYHVSNVREDGTIPTVEPQSWQQLNTFRTNAQIEGGGICQPAG